MNALRHLALQGRCQVMRQDFESLDYLIQFLYESSYSERFIMYSSFAQHISTSSHILMGHSFLIVITIEEIFSDRCQKIHVAATIRQRCNFANAGSMSTGNDSQL